jgi:hypothetical protein
VDCGPEPTNVFDPRNLWWRHELLHRSTMVAYSTLMPRYRYARHRTEARWIADPPPSPSSFRAADQLERRWLDDIRDAHMSDGRPAWVRRTWRTIDRAAGLDEELSDDRH